MNLEFYQLAIIISILFLTVVLIQKKLFKDREVSNLVYPFIVAILSAYFVSILNQSHENEIELLMKENNKISQEMQKAQKELSNSTKLIANTNDNTHKLLQAIEKPNINIEYIEEKCGKLIIANNKKKAYNLTLKISISYIMLHKKEISTSNDYSEFVSYFDANEYALYDLNKEYNTVSLNDFKNDYLKWDNSIKSILKNQFSKLKGTFDLIPKFNLLLEYNDIHNKKYSIEKMIITHQITDTHKSPLFYVEHLKGSDWSSPKNIDLNNTITEYKYNIILKHYDTHYILKDNTSLSELYLNKIFNNSKSLNHKVPKSFLDYLSFTKKNKTQDDYSVSINNRIHLTRTHSSINKRVLGICRE